MPTGKLDCFFSSCPYPIDAHFMPTDFKLYPIVAKNSWLLASSAESLEPFEGMQQLVLEFFVAMHRQNQLASGSDDASGALNQVPTQRFDFTEAPKCRPIGGRTTLPSDQLHLQFASKIVRQNTGEQIQLIADTRGHRYVIQLAMRLQFRKNTFLRSTALVECNDLARAGAFIDHDGLEFVTVFDGLKQIELNRCFILAPDLFADEDKAL